jgi:hypothetical protein
MSELDASREWGQAMRSNAAERPAKKKKKGTCDWEGGYDEGVKKKKKKMFRKKKKKIKKKKEKKRSQKK